MVWYSHLFKNFQQFVVIHTAKGFNIVNEAEVGVFLEFPCFLYDQTNVGNLLLAPLKTDSFPRRDSTLQSCPTLCDPTDCSPPVSSVHGILQVRILEWVAIPISRGSSPQGVEPGSPALQADSLPLNHQGSPYRGHASMTC